MAHPLANAPRTLPTVLRASPSTGRRRARTPGAYAVSRDGPWPAGTRCRSAHAGSDRGPAVRLEDADLAVRAEGGRHGAERMRLQEGLGLVKAGPLKTDLADAHVRRRRGLVARERPGVEVP